MQFTDDHQRIQQRIVMALPRILLPCACGNLDDRGESMSGVILCLSVLQTLPQVKKGLSRCYAGITPSAFKGLF
jgi:hypothetical protein